MTSLENVYHAVSQWKTGKAAPEVAKFYAQLVKDGIVGKNI